MPRFRLAGGITAQRVVVVLLAVTVLIGAGHTVWAEFNEPPGGPALRAASRTADANSGLADPSGGSNATRSSPSRPADPSHNVWAGILPGNMSPRVAGDPTYVYVPNGRPGTVEEIDPKTFKIVRRFSLGYRSFPEHVTPSWDMRWLYVDTSAASELAVIDPRTGRLHRIIHGVEHPYNLYFTPDGSRAIDVAEYYNQLRFLDPHTMKVQKVLPMPCRGPDHLDFSGTGHYLLIGCEFDGNLIKVDWRTMRVVSTMNIGGLPVDVKLAPSGTVFYVANQGTGGVYIVDPARMKVLKFIRTGRGAHGMAISRDTTKLYLTNRLAGTISVIDFATRSLQTTWYVGGSPDMVQISPDGSQLWETNRYGTTVTVVDTRNGHVIKQIEVGPDPHGLAYFPQPGNYSLGHNGVYR